MPVRGGFYLQCTIYIDRENKGTKERKAGSKRIIQVINRGIFRAQSRTKLHGTYEHKIRMQT